MTLAKIPTDEEIYEISKRNNPSTVAPFDVFKAREMGNKMRADTFKSKFVEEDKLFVIIQSAILDNELFVCFPSLTRNVRLSYEQVKLLIKLGYKVVRKPMFKNIYITWEDNKSWLTGFNTKHYKNLK